LAKITFEEFISALLHWHETTSTPPSGLHLGIYMALVMTHIKKGSKFNRDETEDNQNIDMPVKHMAPDIL
jgi:hypothetical protein